MPEAYLFSIGRGASAHEALSDALRRAGLAPRAVSELTWLGTPPPPLPGDAPLLALPAAPAQAHHSLQALTRRLIAGERGLLALGQSDGAGHFCLVLGGPAVVGRLNLLPAYRLHPAPPLPADGARAAEDFRLWLAPPPPVEEPTPPKGPQEQVPLVISPAAPPPDPLPSPEPPDIDRLLCEAGETPIFPAAARLPPAPGLEGLAALLADLAPDHPWGAWVTPLARGWLLSAVERL